MLLSTKIATYHELCKQIDQMEKEKKALADQIKQELFEKEIDNYYDGLYSAKVITVTRENIDKTILIKLAPKAMKKATKETEYTRLIVK